MGTSDLSIEDFHPIFTVEQRKNAKPKYFSPRHAKKGYLIHKCMKRCILVFAKAAPSHQPYSLSHNLWAQIPCLQRVSSTAIARQICRNMGIFEIFKCTVRKGRFVHPPVQNVQCESHALCTAWICKWTNLHYILRYLYTILEFLI